MCDPITALVVTGIAATAASTGVSMYAAHKQGEYAEKTAEYNAKVSEQQAQQATEAGATEEQQHRQKVVQFEASQRAAMASSGALVDSGSFGDVLDTTVKTGEMDALTIRENALRKAWGYRVGADVERSQGAMAKSAANANMVGSLLTGATSTFGMIAKAKKDGTF
jgi:hypothetical protein